MGKSKRKIVVIGAGAAGLMAAVAASDAGADVTVLEKNEKAGKKIYITGKGRCNFTNACDTPDFFENVVRNPKFLYSAIYDYDQQHVIDFLEQNGCPTKVERGKRAFPLSDHASDVTKAFTDHLRHNGVRIQYHTEVREILSADDPDTGEKKVAGVRLTGGKKLAADAVIVCTGGVSYESTGSTGDGYRFASDLGMQVTDRAPSLVPFTVKEDWCPTLQGLSLKNVAVTVVPNPDVKQDAEQNTSAENEGKKKKSGKKPKKVRPVYEGFGEMMFTHFGITGPLILSASSQADFVKYPSGFTLTLDLKPALSVEQLDERLRREFEVYAFRSIPHAIRSLFPERLTEVVAHLFDELLQKEAAQNGIQIRPMAERTARMINEKERRQLAELIKSVPITITGTRGFNEAIVTKGGIAVKEINPSTMEAKHVSGLYAAGEVLDVDAVTGGFNLQIAWSTGHLAGESAATSDVYDD